MKRKVPRGPNPKSTTKQIEAVDLLLSDARLRLIGAATPGDKARAIVEVDSLLDERSALTKRIL